MRDLVSDTAQHAAERLVVHAPGSIDMLVDVTGVEHSEHGIEAVAGVTKDFSEQGPGGGASDPSDWPIFPDIGTGVYGEHKRPITMTPGTYPMSWEVGNARFFAWSIEGQPAQDYSGASFRDTVEWLPIHVEMAAAQIHALT